MAPRPSLFEAPRNALRQAADGSLGPALQALLAATVLAAAKVVVHLQGWEILATGVPVLTALLGAVVFTLAIVLAGVLTDFKEAERGLGEVVSQVRRLHWDFAMSGADEATVRELRGLLVQFTAMVRENARHGFRWRLRDLHGPIDAMDQLIVGRVKAPWPTTRTAQTGLGTLSRNVDRLEVIVETTFMRAGYAFAAAAIGVVLACFLLAPLGDTLPAALLFGAVSFVLVGLYLLVRDLDNPLSGSVRINTVQLDKLLALLKARQEAPADSAPPMVVLTTAAPEPPTFN